MSGDRTPRDYVAGVAHALREDSALSRAAGRRSRGHRGRAATARCRPSCADRAIEIVPAAEVVAMDESPREAIRRKKHSSMRLAIDAGEGRARARLRERRQHRRAHRDVPLRAEDAGGRRARGDHVRPFPPRTATRTCSISAPTPRRRPSSCCSSARWGRSSRATFTASSAPARGPAQHRRRRHEGARGRAGGARAAAARAGLNYIGFVEGDDIFSGDVDVVVTDGFTGNVALKTMEGVGSPHRATACRSEFSVVACSASWPGSSRARCFERAAASLDPRRYNGACMVGLDGIVVKSHGGADSLAFSRAISLAAQAARRGLTAHIAQALQTQRS